MSFRRQIDALTKKRNAHLDAMSAISELAANENRLLTEDEQKAFDKDQGEVRDIDGQLVKLHDAEQQAATLARPAPSPLADNVVEVKFKPAFKAQSFTRFAGALALSKGNLLQAAEIAKKWQHETPEVLDVLQYAATIGNTNDPAAWLQRAAVAVGNTTSTTWAKPLVNYTQMVSEFIELLRPATIYGRMSGYRSVPFNVKIPRQTAGSTAGWVGEGLSKPVSSLAFDDITFPWAKIAVIIVITQELARFSDPSAERLVRDDMVEVISQFIDQQMWDATVAASAGLRPGALTNGSSSAASLGTSVTHVTQDLTNAMLRIAGPPNNIPLRNPLWLMTPANAMFLATLRTAQDVVAFPGMQMSVEQVTGQNLLGIPVLTSPAIDSATIILIEQSQVMIADDGQTVLDASGEASVQMDSAPATPPTPLVSFWQQNLLGIKAERFIYWMMRRAAAVTRITAFPAAAP